MIATHKKHTYIHIICSFLSPSALLTNPHYYFYGNSYGKFINIQIGMYSVHDMIAFVPYFVLYQNQIHFHFIGKWFRLCLLLLFLFFLLLLLLHLYYAYLWCSNSFIRFQFNSHVWLSVECLTRSIWTHSYNTHLIGITVCLPDWSVYACPATANSHILLLLLLLL